MSTTPDSPPSIWRRLRLPYSHEPNAWLLLALVTLVISYPFLDDYDGGRAAIAIFDLAILMLALRAVQADGGEKKIGYLLVIPAVVLHVSAALVALPALLLASYGAQAAFHGFVVICLLRYMLRDDIMTLDELFAAAAFYVLLAFVFAYLYACIEQLVPGAFFINEANRAPDSVRWWDLLYFSFTCLTSVGFGDITPVSDYARSLVMIQQMVGVLYFALIVSRLVSLQTKGKKRD
ncbi:potassium channel family protein [Chitinimonas lacunae]|uniref:Potassium channel family protein n=1 Tax=Chitinimonas lacunae TaxID=1963018 RepID=A0ABV8MI28_9NEIS